ncbi:MAG: alpha/beta fold hydrolase [Gemmatimonadaceae bacterium]|nr:alpha/beta fold hydrolase [Gemmatimonadaceae bacterium]
MPSLPHARHTPALPQQSIGAFTFEDGTTVADAAMRYALVPPDGPSDGIVVICPSLTGTPAILQEWWGEVGPAVARERYATLYPHAFTPGTLAAFPRERPPTIRDFARGIVALVRALGLPQATFVTGGSLGGMIALETAIESGAPTHALVLAAPAVQTAWGAGWNMVQLKALAIGDGAAGFELARAVGMMTYRTEREFEARFGGDAPSAEGRTMATYLEHQGRKLVARFDPVEYEQRVRAMDTHDVGRGRGGWRDVLAPLAHRIAAAGVAGDALYSAEIVEAWARATGVAFHTVTSIHGHDAFLLERAQVRSIIASAFERATLDAAESTALR